MERVRRVVEELVVDSEKAYVRDMLDPGKMVSRLKDGEFYSFRYSVNNGRQKITLNPACLFCL